MTRALIAGAAETEYLRRPEGRTTHELLALAVREALADARLEARDVDGLGVASFTIAPDHAADLAWRLGLRLGWLMEDSSGGASALNLLAHAVRAVEAGDAKVVVLVAGDVFGSGDFRRLADAYNIATRDHLAPIPAGGPNALFALLTQRHMAAHGLGREVYGRVAVAQRAWAALNENAVFREPLTLDDYLAAPRVADPLCLLDCAPIVSGADAVVVTAAERAARPAVGVRALVTSFNSDGQEGDGLRTGLAERAARLWSGAGVGPYDLDVLSVYDDYPVMVLVQLGDLGLVEDGDLRRLVETRIATRKLALNTTGGQLSAGQAGRPGDAPPRRDRPPAPRCGGREAGAGRGARTRHRLRRRRLPLRRVCGRCRPREDVVKPLAGGECAQCGHVAFPRLLLCPRCAGSEWRPRVLETGTVEQASAIWRMPGADPAVPVPIGSVRADAGPVVVARLDIGVGPGERVVLADDGGAPFARKPQTSTA